VERILTMQTDKGGFTYWPGGREAHPYGSLYAAAALSLAKANGLAVNEQALAPRWVTSRASWKTPSSRWASRPTPAMSWPWPTG